MAQAGRQTFIITRPAEDSARFVQAAQAAGHEVLATPLLTIRFDETAPVPERPYQAVAITSANGARAIAVHPARERLTRARAITVGPASTRAAREAGFADVLQAQGDVKALIATVTEKLEPQNGPLLYASGKITRGDLQGVLGERGFDVDRVVFYEAVAANSLSAEVRAILESGKCATVALYSPRSARIWSALVKAAGLEKAAASQRYACLSQNVASALAEDLPAARDILVPSSPDEPALLAALGLAK